MKTKLILYVVLMVMSNLFAQEINLIEAPEDYRLYARDASDSAKVFVSGIVKGEPDFKEFTLKVFKDNILLERKIDSLRDKKFSISTKIHSGLHQYRFEFYTKKNNRDSLYFVADNVVCGDAYIISGQSNSHASSSLSTYQNPYCRSFGVKTGFETYNEEDKKVRWGLATGNAPDLEGVGGWFTKNPYGVGVWGMELMKRIVEKHQVPVCIINGGSGSSTIEQNMLYLEQPTLETSFGRLAYRVNQAGLKNKIKALLWHQGEANTSKTEKFESYESNFDTLLVDWKRLYVNLEKVYLFQLYPGCGGDYASRLREKQNQISDKYEMINIMSTNGVVGHDGCHFSDEGYKEFAERIFPLLSRDFYGGKSNTILTPPKLLSANYDNPNQIGLTFDQPISFNEKKEIKGNVHYLKNQFFFSKAKEQKQISNRVKTITIKQNQLILHIKKNSVFDQITYLPNKLYLNTQDIYSGPWIIGVENNIGALSFHQRLIVNSEDVKNKR